MVYSIVTSAQDTASLQLLMIVALDAVLANIMIVLGLAVCTRLLAFMVIIVMARMKRL